MSVASLHKEHCFHRETVTDAMAGREIVQEKGRSLDNWTAFWKTSNNFFDTTTNRRQARSCNARWQETFNEPSRPDTIRRDHRRVEEIFGLLGTAGFRAQGARILDIGSGPGAIALPFARAGARVTALDVSGDALERLSSDADREGLAIETIESSWWHADVDRLGLRKKFDLVFVTNTPAVKDPESLDRMIQCSRDLCFYGFHIRSDAYTRVDHEEIYRNVLKREPRRPTFGKGSFFINGFIYVYLMGYRPLVRIVNDEETRIIGAAEMAEREIRAIERLDACTEDEKSKIREYYRRAAPEGPYQIRPGSYAGMMVWPVNPPGSYFDVRNR